MELQVIVFDDILYFWLEKVCNAGEEGGDVGAFGIFLWSWAEENVEEHEWFMLEILDLQV